MQNNCHGLTFADRKFWINDDQVETILTGDGYQMVTATQVGDVGIYRDQFGQVKHSVTVSEVDQDGNVVEVSGLGGIELRAQGKTPAAAWPGGRITYYRRANDGRSVEDCEYDAKKVETLVKP
jgi:hypothetical protein